MSATITVDLENGRARARLDRAINNTNGLMRMIGGLMVAASHRAFEEQRFGDVVWSERYPASREPFINVAPVIRNAGMGRAPTADDFRRRPALGGAGSDLSQSISFRHAGEMVEVTSSRPWAGLFNFGGVGSIPITDRTRETLGRWLGITGTTGRGRNVLAGRTTDDAVGMRVNTMAFARRFAFVFQPERTEMHQRTRARPFVGFTEETFRDIVQSLADHVGGTPGAVTA